MSKIEVYEDAKGLFRWRMVSNNGRIIADSGEGYDSKSNAKRAVQQFQDAVVEAGQKEPVKVDEPQASGTQTVTMNNAPPPIVSHPSVSPQKINGALENERQRTGSQGSTGPGTNTDTTETQPQTEAPS